MPPPPTTEVVSFTAKQKLLVRIVPPVAAALIRALCATLRFEEVLAPGAHPADRDTQADLYPFWHRCLLLAAYRYRSLGIRILISSSFDGELIARTVARLGFVPVRGSSSRGGAAGLLALSRALATNHKCAITADGPRGPAFLAKPGAAAIATNAAARRKPQPASKTSMREDDRQERAPGTYETKDERNEETTQNASLSVRPTSNTIIQVSAFYLHPHRAWTLRSWDGFLVPKPFSRVTVAWATPLPATIPDLPTQLQAALEQVTTAATTS